MKEPINIPFMPTSRAEMDKLGWKDIDILLVTGDCYVDHPSYGVSLIGRMLLSQGYRTGIIAQPDWKNTDCMKALGRPLIGAGVTSGNMDSMVNIYTAGRRLRREDAYSEDGQTGLRPPHALVVYTQLVKQAFPGVKVMIGGLEASLRRIAHYDYWQDKLRPSMLVDSKADILSFGQGEKSVTEIFRRLLAGEPLGGIGGTAVLLGKNAALEFKPTEKYQELPSWEQTLADRDAIMTATKMIEAQMSGVSSVGFFQRYGERILVVEPPPEPMTTEELDAVHNLPYSGSPHPKYKKRIPAFETIKHSIPAIRGCPGGCAFCGLVSHQGRHVTSRSIDSIKFSAEKICERKDFHGTISDIGGAAGNIYMSRYLNPEQCEKCRRPSCLFPSICPNYVCDGKEEIEMLRTISKLPKVKHLYINSGIRLDLTLKQTELFRELVRNHVSGHMKLAPEHLDPKVLRLMRKSTAEEFFEVMRRFYEESAKCGKEQYVIPLFISNFPGCGEKEMKTVDDFLNKNNWSPQQVQDYIPLPMTMGAAMYYTGKDSNGNAIPVNRGLKERRGQIQVLKKKRRGPKF
ncbi:MAG: YgiQ family radical SAM protein [Victivallaceae bacterium]|nr:YgiQ family radical SAM protein [Victivallaceae bacterium]